MEKSLFLMTLVIILSGCSVSSIGVSIDKEISLTEKNGLVYKCVSTPSRWIVSLQAPEDFTLASMTKLIRGTSSDGGLPTNNAAINTMSTLTTDLASAVTKPDSDGKPKC